MATAPDDAHAAKAEAARRRLVDCDARLAKYRTALEAGADPGIVAGWMAEVQGERVAAERDLGQVDAGERPQLTKDDVRQLVAQLRDTVGLLAQADPALRAEVYAELGVRVTYHPGRRLVVEAQPQACSTERVGGGT